MVTVYISVVYPNFIFFGFGSRNFFAIFGIGFQVQYGILT
jgi:hypothetical protein